MQTNESGDVILKLGMNTKSAKAAMNDLANSINKVFKAFKGRSVSSPQLDKLNAQAEQSKNKIEEIQQRIDRMNNTAVSSKAMDDLNAEFQKAEINVSNLESKYSEFITAYEQGTISTLPNELQSAYDKIAEIESKTKQLVTTGQDVTSEAKKQPQEFAKANEELRKEQQNLAGIQSKIENVTVSGDNASNGVSNSFRKMGASITGIFSKIKSSAKSSSRSAADSFTNINGAIKKGIRTLVKYGLGMRSLFVLFRKVRSAIVDSYKDLAAYSTEVNDSISNTKSALITLKNSMAAMVQPLVTAFAPLVSSMANRLTAMSQTVGEFFAALTGQKYVYQAVGVQEDYAEALDDTANSAKKAAKSLGAYLSPLDDINRYTSNEAESGTDATAATAKFTKKAVDNNFRGLAERVKEYFSDIFKPIKTAWDKYGQPVISELCRMILNIKGIFSDVARAFKNVWTNGTGEKVTGNILKLWRSLLGVVNSIFDTFRNAWNNDALGESVIQSFIDRFNNLIELIRDVADTFSEIWNNGTGERIWTNILSTVRNVNNIIGGFWKILKKAWDKNEVGQRIWQGILNIVEDISEWLKDLSQITLDWVEDLDLSPMFEAVSALVGAFRDLAKVLMNKFKSAYRDVLLPLGKWAIEDAVPTIINLFGTALEFVADVLDKIPVNVLTGLAAGITAVFAALKAYKIIKTAWGYIKGLGEAFSTLGKTIAAHPYAAAILAIVAAFTALATAISVANKTKWETSDLKKSVDEVNKYFDDVAEAAQNMKSAIEDVNKSHIEIQADVSQVETLKDRLMEVIKDGIINEDEMPEYETIINLLNKVDGFEDMWNGISLETIDGEIHINADEATEALDKFLEQWKLTQWQTALSADYSDIYSSLRINKRDVTSAQDLVDEAKRNLLDKIKETGIGSDYMQLGGHVFKEDWTLEDLDRWYEAYKAGKFQFPLMDSGIKDVAKSYDDAITSLSDYQTNFDELTRSMEGNWEAQKFLNGETDNYIGALYAVQSGLIGEQDMYERLSGTGIDTMWELESAAARQRRAIEDSNSAIDGSNSDLADNTESNNMRILDSGQKAYAGIADSGFEAHEAQNKYQNDVADQSKKSSSTIENNYATAFMEIKAKAAEMWNNLKNIFTDNGSIGNSIGNFAISGVNAIIRGINSAIETICDIINNAFNGVRDFEFAGAKPFEWLPTITQYPQIGEIPALARGAVLPAGKPFVAMLGDQKNGTNLETPESLMRQIVREEIAAGSNQKVYRIPIQIGSRTLFTAIIDEARLQQNQIGYNPLVTLGG